MEGYFRVWLKQKRFVDDSSTLHDTWSHLSVQIVKSTNTCNLFLADYRSQLFRGFFISHGKVSLTSARYFHCYHSKTIFQFNDVENYRRWGFCCFFYLQKNFLTFSLLYTKRFPKFTTQNTSPSTWSGLVATSTICNYYLATVCFLTCCLWIFSCRTWKTVQCLSQLVSVNSTRISTGTSRTILWNLRDIEFIFQILDVQFI